MKQVKPFIPYGHQIIEDEDIDAVVKCLRSEWLTTGPLVKEFEGALASFCGVRYAVTLSSGTASLHALINAMSIERGDKVIVPAITFVATANAVLFQGATPIIADIDPNTLLIDPKDVERKITDRTKAVIAVDYAGQPCDYDELLTICNKYNIYLISDACHALGAQYRGNYMGTFGKGAVFSFHPVKHITTCEGGAIATNDKDIYERSIMFRNHGIDIDFRQRQKREAYDYNMVMLGWNYRLSDVQCALGLSQLRRLRKWIEKRRYLAALYRELLKGIDEVAPLVELPYRVNSFHLFVIRVLPHGLRDKVFQFMRRRGIGVNVHYKPIHHHKFYQEYYKQYYSNGQLHDIAPNAQMVSSQILTLPLYPALNDKDIKYVVEVLKDAIKLYL